MTQRWTREMTTDVSRGVVRIREVRAVGLRGATPKGGWTRELSPDDVVHTLVAVTTDEGLVGVGSAFTSETLVQGSLDVLRSLLIGENALEPERVTSLVRARPAAPSAPAALAPEPPPKGRTTKSRAARARG